MTFEAAKAMVERRFNEGFSIEDGGPVVVIDRLTIHKPYGWIFFVNAAKYLETGDRRYCLIGAGPIIVDHDGTLHKFGTAYPAEKYIEEFELGRVDCRHPPEDGPGP